MFACRKPAVSRRHQPPFATSGPSSANRSTTLEPVPAPVAPEGNEPLFLVYGLEAGEPAATDR